MRNDRAKPGAGEVEEPMLEVRWKARRRELDEHAAPTPPSGREIRIGQAGALQ